MKNSFGQFRDKAFESFHEAASDRFDFKQCKRTDGTIYGVPNDSDCAQKGAREVSPSEGSGPLLELRAKMAKSPEKFEKDVLSKLGTSGLDKLAYALRNTGDPVDKKISQMAKKRADKIRSQEKSNSRPPAKSKEDKTAYGNWFKVNGYSNHRYLGRLAALNNLLVNRGVVSDSEFEKNAKILKKNDPNEVKKLAGFLTVRAKEQSPEALKAVSTSSSSSKSPKPAPAKASKKWNATDTKNQYRNFYGQMRARGLGHMDATAGAKSALEAVGRNRNIELDMSGINGKFRSSLRKSYQ